MLLLRVQTLDGAVQVLRLHEDVTLVGVQRMLDRAIPAGATVTFPLTNGDYAEFDPATMRVLQVVDVQE